MFKFITLTFICWANTVFANPFLQLNGFTSHQVNESLFVLKSPYSNTNVGVFVGNESILLIDPVVGEKANAILVSAIKAISDKPIKVVINTHSHNDHSGANQFYNELGASVISIKNGQFYSNSELIASSDTYSIQIEEETLDLFHFVSHSTSDIVIHFKQSNTLFMGDTYMHDIYPHSHAGGSRGIFEVIDRALSLADDSTNIVTAHGRLITQRDELLAFKKKSQLWYKRINELIHQKISTEAVLKDSELIEISQMFRPLTPSFFEQQVKKTLRSESEYSQ